MTIPKVAVLVTGLTAAVLVATINPTPAQATPRAKDCAGCHAVGGTTTAKPSTITPVAGAPYTVAITLAANPAGGNSGWAIVAIAPATGSAFGGDSSSASTYTATMTAPAAAGTYSYNVYTNQGSTDPDGFASGTQYSITVAPVVTTPPPTTTTTTKPPTTTTTTTPPPTTTTTTKPPTTTTTTTKPPTTTTTTTPPSTTTAVISWLSRTRGEVGSRVTIRGTGFGTSGVVQFGTVAARASFWTSTSITVKVPVFATEGGKDADHEGDHQAQRAWVTVTPTGAAASNGVLFRLASGGHDGGHDGCHDGDDDDDSHSDAPRHHIRLGGDFD